jgi:hypothetical protein
MTRLKALMVSTPVKLLFFRALSFVPRAGHALARTLPREYGKGGKFNTCGWAKEEGGEVMLWTILVVLLVLWLLGFTVFHVGALIHLLLVIALVILVINLLSGRRPVV